MDSHCTYVWSTFVAPSHFKHLYIVAHSAGGPCRASIQKIFAPDFYKRVSKIALTDSAAIARAQLTAIQRDFMWKRCVLFVASKKPLGDVVSSNPKTEVCVKRSAGHPKHEYTTGYAFWEIVKHFKFK